MLADDFFRRMLLSPHMFDFRQFQKPVALVILLSAASISTAVAQTNSQAAPANATPPPHAALPTPTDGPIPGLSDEKSEEKQSANVVKHLPPGMDPNPPSDDDLKTSKLTWKGEYEATKDGDPVLGLDDRPIPVLYNSKGKRVKSKIKPPHSYPLSVVAGTLTVDGWTGKARLNYDIPEQSFLYFSVPAIGTVVASQNAFPGAREQKAAIDGSTLTIHLQDHDIQLASDKPLYGKAPVALWVRLDPDFHKDPRWPVMGYGPVSKPPYAWPGAKAVPQKGIASAPPLPAEMRPAIAVPVCISGIGTPCATIKSVAAR